MKRHKKRASINKEEGVEDEEKEIVNKMFVWYMCLLMTANSQ
jgi:hypothetical protein